MSSGLAALEISDLNAARERIQTALPPTPLVRNPALDAELGCEAWVKLENTTAVGAFKIRGGLNLLMSMNPAERQRGICAPTRGNHGQSLAYACAWAEAPCTLFVPEGNNPEKNRAMRELGADLVVGGSNFEAARSAAEDFAQRSGARFVHPGKEPLLIAGIGTLGLEILEQCPEELDYIFAPVGVGSCIAGIALALGGSDCQTKIIGVQSASAPAMYRAWREGGQHAVTASPSLADGLAVSESVAETLELMRGHVEEMLLVQEGELAQAMQLYAGKLRQIAEGAGAAALAGALQKGRSLAGKRIAVVLSGGNVDPRQLSLLLAGNLPESAAWR
ncbi:MAG: threonine ammonia-lyase [Planctomycetota bacterium]|jgi:threonine dehydratase